MGSYGVLGPRRLPLRYWVYLDLDLWAGDCEVAATGRRGARGDWWLRLSSTGFEVNDRLAKPRRHEWREIDKFLLVASREGFDDGSFRVIHRVGFRYTPERRRRIATKRWTIKRPPRDRNGTTADGFVMDYWDRPLDEAVDLMNEWLARYKAA